MSVQTRTAPRAALAAFRPWRMVVSVVMLLAVILAMLPYYKLTAYDPGTPAVSPSAQRAAQTVALLSQETRSVGDPHHDTARDWLAAELRGLGMEVQTQEGLVYGLPAPLVNVMGRLKGQNGRGEALLLMAHYDSEPGSPGASDNGSGVSIVLEIARALAAGPRPANDLIVLFTDAEEHGIRGAGYFLAGHDWAGSVRAVLNFDGISTGPVFLWQTNPRNGWLIERFAATPRPAAMSWVDGISRVMPLITDIRPFRQAGVTGASFSTPYLPAEYHTPLDRPALVNPATLEHGIQQGLALALALLAGDLSATTAPDRVYLSLWEGLFVNIPAQVGAELGVLAGLLTVIALIMSLRRAAARLRAVASAVLFTAANLLCVFLLQYAVEVVTFVKQPMLSPWIKIPASLALLTLVLGFGYGRMQKRLTAGELLLGGQLVWAVGVVASSLTDPLFSPLLTAVLLASLLPYALPTPGSGGLRASRMLTLALTLLLGAPVVYLLFMISGRTWTPAATGAFVFTLLFALVYPMQEMAVKGES